MSAPPTPFEGPLPHRPLSRKSTASQLAKDKPTSQNLHGFFHVYDTVGAQLFNFFYDVLHLSSGRDKLLAFVQHFCKLQYAQTPEHTERAAVYLGVANSLSSSRKAFRFLKFIREIYKIRRAVDRFETGYEGGGWSSLWTWCGLLDICGHSCSFAYFLLDNVLWGVSVGIFRSSKVPTFLLPFQQEAPTDGLVVGSLGGLAQIKYLRNHFSFWRTVFALVANIFLWRLAYVDKVEELNEQRGDAGKLSWGAKLRAALTITDPEDRILFHSLELTCIVCDMTVLLSALRIVENLGPATQAKLQMIAAAAGIWRMWRKVLAKQFGTRSFGFRGAFLTERHDTMMRYDSDAPQYHYDPDS